jgi:hypothetical protein
METRTTRDGVGDFVEALLADQRPKSFRASTEGIPVLRAAVALRAARPGDGSPDAQFVSDLGHDLAEQVSARQAHPTGPPNISSRRRGMALSVAAATIVVVGGTAATTSAVDHHFQTVQAEHGAVTTTLRSGRFRAVDGQPVGHIQAYRGSPAWIFMNVDASRVSGTVVCELQTANGQTVPVGVFEVHDGIGEFAHTVGIDVGQLHGAKLLTAAGSTLASAAFS